MTEPARGAEAVPEAANDASRGPAARAGGRDGGFGARIRAAGLLGWVLLALTAIAALLLVIADFSTISYRTIGIGACSSREAPGVCSTVGHDQHGYALVILGVLAFVMGVGAAAGRSRAAALAVFAIGGVVVGIFGIAIDYPTRDDQRGLDARYSDVSGHLGSAFKLELVGGVLLVLAGGLALARPGPAPPTRRRERVGVAAD